MPIEFDGPNSKVSANVIEAQSGSTITILSGHNLSGGGSGLTALNAANLASGTLPMARLSGTLPALNGSALTALNATQATSGTFPMARLSGTLAALNGANLTALNGSNIASGTVADARISALTASKLTGALPAISGASLTGVTGSSKNGSLYLNLATATGTIAVTSMGFTPKHLIVHWAIDNRRMVGFGMMGTMTRFSIASEDYNNVWWPNNAGQIRVSGGTMQLLDLSSLDANGFTLSHTKSGSPTGSVRISWIAFG